MNKTDKTALIAELKDKFEGSQFFYITDSSTLTVEKTNQLRRKCFENNVEMRVLKNTLVQKALEQIGAEDKYAEIIENLKGPTAVMFTDKSNLPAKLIKDFRGQDERPLVKAAYIEGDVFVGDDQLATLAALKSKEELVGEIIALLQSPIKNVVGALQSSGHKLSGLLKTLGDRPE